MVLYFDTQIFTSCEVKSGVGLGFEHTRACHSERSLTRPKVVADEVRNPLNIARRFQDA